MIPCDAPGPFASACLALALIGSVSARAENDGWPHYGGSLAGDRYAAPSAITPERALDLSLAWTY